MVVQWVIQAQWRPLPTTKEVKTDPGVESQGRSQAQLQRSADFPWLGKEKKNRKRTGEWKHWNGKDLPAMCDKNVPAKTLATQRVSICTRKMTYSQMPHLILYDFVQSFFHIFVTAVKMQSSILGAVLYFNFQQFSRALSVRTWKKRKRLRSSRTPVSNDQDLLSKTKS